MNDPDFLENSLDEREPAPQKSNQRLIIILLLILLAVLIGFFAMRGCGTLQPAQEPTPSAQLPEAPSNLAAHAVLLYDIPVSWQDNSDNEDGFRVYREGSDKPGEKVEAGSVAANQTEFLDLGTACGVTYQYTVASYNAAGESPTTECWQIALPVCPTPAESSLPPDTDSGNGYSWAQGGNGPVLKAPNGVYDLGELGSTPLFAATIPANAEYTEEVPAVEGHSYVAPLGADQWILFTITGLGDAMDVVYIFYNPQAAITSDCGEPTPTLTETAIQTAAATSTLTITPSWTPAEDTPTPTVTNTPFIPTRTPTDLPTDTPTVITDTPAPPPPACGSFCYNNADCAGLGANPVCAGGSCWDAGLCGPPDDGGGTGGGGEDDCRGNMLWDTCRC